MDDIKQFFSSLKSRLRIIAFLEGMSFLILLLIAMPLKYMFDFPELVRVVGWAHGGLIVWYVLLIIRAKILFEWSFGELFMAGIASLIPGGTFYADHKLFKHSSVSHE